MSERAILHSDANSFYASVETVLDPSLRGKAVAVCGSTEERHGIVLAKSDKAKKAGVRTGMVTWQAKKLCPDLIILPPHYEYYIKFSRYLHEIYQRFTDQVEPFGMDECWIDVTHTRGKPMDIADEIRRTVRDELGLTVSIGVSFNKIFAKLGSDMKKPDAITEITTENFREKIWPLECSELLYCGRATTGKMANIGVHSIGQMAQLPVEVMKSKLGKNGVALWNYANGFDTSRVAHEDYMVPAKSVGHGITCTSDLETQEEAIKVIIALSQDIGYKLRLMRLQAKTVQLFVKDKDLVYYGWQAPFEIATQDESKIAQAAVRLLEAKYRWNKLIRALTVSATKLESIDAPIQMRLFEDYESEEKKLRLNKCIDDIRERFGKDKIKPAIILDEKKMPKGADHEIIMPGYMYQ